MSSLVASAYTRFLSDPSLSLSLSLSLSPHAFSHRASTASWLTASRQPIHLDAYTTFFLLGIYM